MNGKVISGPAAILILFLFFLPWTSVSCDGLPASELSGLQLALDPDLNSDPIFLVVPITAVVTLLLLVSTLWKPAWETNANWGMVIASIAGLLVFLLKWLQLRGQSSGSFEITILPALWVTVASLLSIGLGAVFDLLRTPQQIHLNVQKGQTRSAPNSPAPSPPWPAAPQDRDPNYTWVDEGARVYGANATVVDDGSPFADSHATVVDDGLPLANPNLTVLEDERPFTIIDSKRTLLEDDMGALGYPDFDQSQRDNQATIISTGSHKPIEPTEILSARPQSTAWLIITNGEQAGEQFQLKGETTIGRDPKSSIFINDSALSALHIMVKLVNGRFIAIDQNSTNGLLVFDAQQNTWEKQDQVVLEEGAQIRLGRTDLRFTVQTYG
jgi:hypothetical protein